MANNFLPKDDNSILPFGKRNYIIVGIGILMCVLGYYLISTENFIDAREFSVALYIAPPIIVAGLVVVGYGILAKDPAVDANNKEASE